MDKENNQTGIDLKLFKKWLEDNYGKKCGDYSVGCIECAVWRIYEDLDNILED